MVTSALRRLGVLFVLVVVTFVAPLGAHADPLSQTDYEALYNGTEWYVGELASGCPVTDSTQAISGGSIGAFAALPFVTKYMKEKASNIAASMPRYQRISAATGMPWQLVASFHLREGGANPKAAILDGRIPPYTNPDWNRYFPTVESADKATIGYIRKHFSYDYPDVYVNGKSGTVVSSPTLKQVQEMGASWKTGGWWKKSGKSLNDFPYDMNYWDSAHADMVWQSWMQGDVGPGKISAGTHDGNPGLVTDYAYLVQNGGGTITGALDASGGCAVAAQPDANGKFIYYSQNDPKWGDLPFNGGDIKGSGCGATSYAMAVANLNHDPSVTPATIAAWAKSFSLGSVGLDLAKHGVSEYGIQQKPLGTNISAVVAALKAGQWVIISGAADHAPYYGGSGHIVLAHGITADGKLIIADPERGANDKYDPSTVKSGMKYSAALYK